LSLTQGKKITATPGKVLGNEKKRMGIMTFPKDQEMEGGERQNKTKEGRKEKNKKLSEPPRRKVKCHPRTDGLMPRRNGGEQHQ